MRSVIGLLKRFHSDERGIFAVIFGVMAIVLVALAGAAVDYTAMETARARMQIAMDSAALGLVDDIYNEDATEQQMATAAENVVLERLANDPTLSIAVDEADIDIGNATLRLTGTVTVPMAFVQLVGIPSLTATVVSEATRRSINLEVAIALDNTGSMGDDIAFLTEGLNGVIDILVNDIQEPTYTKMALAPYADGVNAGDYAADIRGAIPAARPIDKVYWNGPLLDITNATKTNPLVVTTSTNHGYNVGDIVFINGVTGMTQLNSKFYRVGAKTNTTISLQTPDGTNTNINGTSGYSTFTGATTNNNDKVRKCLSYSTSAQACQVYVDSTDHGFATGDYVRTNELVGVTENNTTYRSKFFTVTRVSANTYSLDGLTSKVITNPSLATGGGTWCTNYGCEWYRFTRKNRTDQYTYRVSKCVTERTTNTYTDAPPTTTLLGPNYVSNTSGNCDMPNAIVPLTSDKDVLHAAANAMDDYGSTAGHLGTAWAWYLLSPTFGYIWDDAEAAPSEYHAENTMKVAILMTDGAYNLQYCNGVVDGTINCNAPASSTTQARELCTKMKLEGIEIFTVGFRIAANSSQATTLNHCSTDVDHRFLPTDGEELVDDFRTIAQAISDLRLSF
jgi:Flp pilus assembly protein TadG